MSRSAINFLLDSFLLLAFVSVLGSAGVLAFVFPAREAATGWTLWGVAYQGWLNMHVGLLAVMALAVLLHLVMHWTWVCGFVAARATRWLGRTVRVDESAKTLYGVVLLITVFVMLGTLLTAATLTVQDGGRASSAAGAIETHAAERAGTV